MFDLLKAVFLIVLYGSAVAGAIFGAYVMYKSEMIDYMDHNLQAGSHTRDN